MLDRHEGQEVKPEPGKHETNADGSITVILHDPIKVGSKDISAVTIKKPKTKHLRGVKIGLLSDDPMLLEPVVLGCSDLDSSVEFGELSAKDAFEILGVVSSFLA